jgi:hypothetical protein
LALTPQETPAIDDKGGPMTLVPSLAIEQESDSVAMLSNAADAVADR